MPIHLECPNPKCKVKLTIKDHLAGKRALCPKCKHPILIPAPVDLEALAAAALGDDPAARSSQATTIDFTCPFCDEELHLPREMGGKQTSCPNVECRRIIKVPMPKEERPEDWRSLKRTGPTGAKENVEAPRLEGAWDTARSTVSGEALVEAGAIEEEKEPVTAAQWVRRGVAATAAGLLLVASVLGVNWYLSSSHLQSLLEQGLSYADAKSSLPLEWKAALETSAAAYYLDDGKQEEAFKHLSLARSLLTLSPAGTERDAGLRDVALAQTRLAGGPTQEELRRTLDGIGDEDARLGIYREVLGTLLAAKREEVAVALIQRFGKEQPKSVPKQVEVKSPPDDESGDEQPKAAAKPAPKKQPPPPITISLIPSQRIALDVALDKAARAKLMKACPTDPKESPELITRLGYAEGLARLDNFAQAQGLARMPGPRLDRLRTWLALSDIARAAGNSEMAARCAREALTLFEAEFKKARLSPWHVWQMARTVARSVGDEAQAKELADSIQDKSLRGRAQLELLQPYLEGTKGRVELSAIDSKVSDKKTLAYGLAMAAMARHNSRNGLGGDEQRVTDLSEEIRPFVLLGAAAGTRDAKR
jgi:hypothetical protein